MIYLETGRLILKPHALANAEKYAAWENDPEMVWVNDDDSDWREPVTVEEIRDLIRHVSRPDSGDDAIFFAIHRKPDGAFIGFGMIHKIDAHHRRCKLGITIGEKSEWGKGYAHEALEAVISYCFDTLGMNRLVAEIYCFNERSIRLFAGLGFQHEGTFRQAVRKQGQFYDDCLYGLLREDWERRERG